MKCMDTNKFYEFFQPEKCKERIHIIGCGAVGSTIAELLARMGIKRFVLYDFDMVESHNIANQMFTSEDIGSAKTEALANMMLKINPDIEIEIVERYNGQMLDGYVFMAVDKISIRKQICEDNYNNPYIKAVFDTRIRLEDAQAYAARWNNYKEKENLKKSMNFTDEEADAETPTSACNMTLSVAPTVRVICNCVVSNFINLVLGRTDDFKKMFLVDAFKFNLDAF